MSRKRLLTPRGKPLEKPGALSGQQRLIRQCGVPPLMYQFGETLTAKTKEVAHLLIDDYLTLLKAAAPRPVETLYHVTNPISYMAVFS